MKSTLHLIKATVVVALMACGTCSRADTYRQVEACFVLDTTGSMSAMIEIAKEKVWFIANQIIHAQFHPDLRLCLTAYRDRGDEYVTRRLDLTRDIDSFYGFLSELKADGGGDVPEAVNQALLETVELTSWSEPAAYDSSPLRVIFLIGDAPPHLDYEEPQYDEIAKMALSRDIVINPVLVGTHSETGRIWKDLASSGGGEDLTLANKPSAPTESSPMDQDLVALNAKLGQLIVPYGTPESQATITDKQLRSEGLTDAAIADRLAFNLATSKVVQGSGDLIQDLDAGLIRSTEIDLRLMPESMRSMTQSELARHLGKIRLEREQLQALIKDLLSQRRKYMDRSNHQTGDRFESLVSQVIIRQMKTRP